MSFSDSNGIGHWLSSERPNQVLQQTGRGAGQVSGARISGSPAAAKRRRCASAYEETYWRLPAETV